MTFVDWVVAIVICAGVYCCCSIIGASIYVHIEENYSENPIWKIVIWFFPIGLIVIFVFKILEWIDDIRDYYRFRR